ncbi:uncharacterized protein I206_105506 [Kwoniella pini CBS 10737]|uniref:Asl1-like glycosyl hydrolase catalytic domain-containing protein n=1 Tax=Kwoniella pini CBS 10737 TaxID=1296096 RepID=A0A1B9I417_9TREE|nr:uncharacterized protein I206_03591 [Kwoniella pini CBS 10737]OCF50272.1 hypothetical protein I206_03591 [Kwoniella pini CBS 10737]
MFLPPVSALILINLPFISLISALNDNLTGPGLAWPNKLWVPMGGFTSPGTIISSYYNWDSNPLIPSIKDLSNSIIWEIPFPFIPMLWGCNETYIKPFQKNLLKNFNNILLTSKKEILGFNEPDHPQQSFCEPKQAALIWKEILEPLKLKGFRLGSPAVTNGEIGKKRFKDWFDACKGECNPDFLALHWYDIIPQNFIEHIEYYHNEYNLPIWITEYAPQNFSVYNSETGQYDGQATYIEVQRFMDITTAYMKSVDWVERWFWFGAMYDMQGVNELDCLFDAGGKPNRTGALNELGVQYAGSNGSVTIQNSMSSGTEDTTSRASGKTKLYLIGITCCLIITEYLIEQLK